MTMIVQDTEYFHKSLMKLSQNNLNQLRTMKQNLETIFKSRLIIYTKSITKIKTVWEELQVPILERPILPTKLGTSDMVKVNIEKYTSTLCLSCVLVEGYCQQSGSIYQESIRKIHFTVQGSTGVSMGFLLGFEIRKR